jgi:8-oxo-dGTP pyrophosphatase MutT (NUDIX family)
MAGKHHASTEPVVSASVLLVRDPVGDPAPAGDGGVEVLLLERHLDSDFAGGAYVFPGGKVDAADRDLDPARWTGRPLSWWVPRLGVATPADALGLLVCAVRETFEEAGVLLASYEDGSPLSADALSSPSFGTARQRLTMRGAPWDWRPWLEDEGITLDLGALAPWSWWVTPEGMHRRFDTRFFIAAMPSGQTAVHDEVETTDLRWVRPADALARQARGEAVIIFPTRRNLAEMVGYRTAQELVDAAAGRDEVPRIEPTIVMVDGRAMVQHPFEDEPSIP